MIPLKQIQNAILAMDAHLSPGEFSCLCYAIYQTRSLLPGAPQMKAIYSDVKAITNRDTSSSASKCVERAVRHLFERGDRNVLASYQASWRFERPFPNEFIRVVAIRLWDGLPQGASLHVS